MLKRMENVFDRMFQTFGAELLDCILYVLPAEEFHQLVYVYIVFEIFDP